VRKGMNTRKKERERKREEERRRERHTFKLMNSLGLKPKTGMLMSVFAM
jgi:hypothetical protein